MARKRAEKPQEEKDEEQEKEEEKLNSRIRATLRVRESTCERKPKEHNLFTDIHCRSILSAGLVHTQIYVACIAVHLNIILRSVRWCLKWCLYVKKSKFYAHFSSSSCVLYFPSISYLLVLRYVLFWDITERSVLMPYRRFLKFEDGKDRLSQHIGMALKLYAA